MMDTFDMDSYELFATCYRCHSTPCSYSHGNSGIRATISRLIAGGIDVSKPIQTYGDFAAKMMTPLQLACMKGNPIAVKILLENGASKTINYVASPLGKTALHYAVMTGEAEIVSMLLLEGADVMARYGTAGYFNPDGDTPFDIACAVGNVKIVKMLYVNIMGKISRMDPMPEGLFKHKVDPAKETAQPEKSAVATAPQDAIPEDSKK